jgi:ABC-2 type transport system permease protein
MSGADTSICVENLTKVFPAKHGQSIVANDGIGFTVRRGEIFGLLGPNGAGKTTLVHQILGLLSPSSGSIILEGVDVIRYPQIIKGLVGFLPQTGIPMRWIEVERALYYTGRLRRQSDIDARKQTEDLIQTLELQPFRDRYVNRLSGGMKRLVNVAMALMGWPPVLVLDEPTNELDPAKRRIIWSLIQRLNAERNTTCILVTHNVLEAEQVIQQVLVLQQGKVVAFGTPGELKQRLGGMVKLSLRTRDDHPLSPDAMNHLMAQGVVEKQRTGHYTVHIRPDQVAHTTNIVVQHIGLDRLDDFRLAPPSLEDVYMHLDGAHGKEQESDADIRPDSTPSNK